jgi:hypothetical protein
MGAGQAVSSPPTLPMPADFRSQGEDRRLAFGERVALRVHLAICKGCRNVNAQFRFLRQAVQDLSRDGDDKETA